MFSPSKAVAERNALAKQGKRPHCGSYVVKNHYDANSYANAVVKAVERHNRQCEEKDKLPTWRPNRLRHTAATRIRKEKGLDAARAMLGQKSLGMADHYAEIDNDIAAETARELC